MHGIVQRIKLRGKVPAQERAFLDSCKMVEDFRKEAKGLEGPET